MSEGDLVRSNVDGRTYRLGPFLKAGLIGAIYPAVSEDSEKRQVAVKLPVVNLSSDGMARFRQEYEVLHALARRLEPPLLVPWIHKGKNLSSGNEALILEFVGDDQLLTRQLPDPDLDSFGRECMLLNAAEQYARLLEALHSLNFTCLDRKLTDLRWIPDEQGGRLIVLDWNVVNEGRSGIPDDIHLFGTMWYQMLTGQNSPEDFNLFDETQWRDGAIKHGMRWIIAKALAPRANRYRDASKLRQMLQQRLKYHQIAPHVLAEQAKSRLSSQIENAKLTYHSKIDLAEGDNAQGYQIAPLDIEAEWQVLDMLDIARRHDNVPADSDFNKSLQLVKHQPKRITSFIEYQFKKKENFASLEAIREARQLSDWINDEKLQLDVARWDVLLRALQLAHQEGNILNQRELADWFIGLQKCLTVVKEVDVKEADYVLQRGQTQLETIRKNAHIISQSDAFDLLNEFMFEIRMRKALKEVEFYEMSGDVYKEADYRAAMRALAIAEDNLLKVRSYRKALLATLPPLDEKRRLLKEKLQTKVDIEMWLNEIEPSKTIGSPGYTSYLLDARLEDVEPILGGHEKFEGTKKWLQSLNALYCSANENNWGAVYREANQLASYSQRLNFYGGLDEARFYQEIGREIIKHYLDTGWLSKLDAVLDYYEAVDTASK